MSDGNRRGWGAGVGVCPAAFRATHRSLLSILLALVCISGTSAQPVESEKPMLIGVYAGYGLNSLTGNLTSGELPGSIPGTGECGSFQEGSGSGLLGGLLFEYRLSSFLSGGLRLEYSNRSGDMTYRCVDPAQARLPDGSLATAETDHVAEISLGTFALHLLVGVRPFQFPLVISAGPSIRFGTGGDYRLTERIVTPRTAEFVTGGQEREYGTGNLAGDGSAVNVGLLGALGYEFPAGDDWRLRPEFSVSIPIGDDLTVGSVRSTGMRLTLALTRAFGSIRDDVPDVPPVVAEQTPEPLPVKPPLRARFEVDNGDGWTEGSLVIRRFAPVNTRLIPLLPYVFFDNRQNELPARYTRIDRGSTDGFDEANLVSHSTLDVYSHVLNIVGSRLRRFPDARLTLTASAPDVAEGTPSTTLARGRAESIRDYLHGVWDIPNERMAIVSRHDPEVPTNPETPEGRAENRRVELSSDRFEVLAPLTFVDTLSPVEEARIGVSLQYPDEGVTSWNIGSWRKEDRTASAQSRGTGPLPPRHEFKLPSLRSFADRDTLMVDLRVNVDDSTIRSYDGIFAIPVRRSDTYAAIIASGEYSLIIFDAANAELREEHRRVIDSIAALLPDDATVSIFGYTDFLGDSAENQSLSERRAEQVAERFNRRRAQIDTVRGLGEDTETFNVLGLPEERMYARRVVIKVERNGRKNDE